MELVNLPACNRIEVGLALGNAAGGPGVMLRPQLKEPAMYPAFVLPLELAKLLRAQLDEKIAQAEASLRPKN